MMPTIQTAMDLQRQGRLQEAEDLYRQVLSSSSGAAEAEALFRLAQINCERGRFAEAIALLRRMAPLEPERARGAVLLGRALLECGDLAEALAVLDGAVACEPDNADAQGSRGDALLQAGRLAEARASYQRAVALAPALVANWCSLGAAQAALGAIDDARASFAQALALAPDDALALTAHGDMLRALDQPALALDSYARALAVTPGQVPALLGQAAALNALGRPGDALASLDAALAIAPADADTLSNRGLLLRALGRCDEALASLERALALDPGHAEALVNRGVVQADLGQYVEAIASCERALAIAPAHLGAHCNRAKALISLNRNAEALAAAERALAIEPAHVEGLFTYGNALTRLRRYEDAIPVLERVLQLAPQHPHARALLAFACLWTCDWDRLDVVMRELEHAMRDGSAIVAPHVLLQLPIAPDLVLGATKRYVERELPVHPPLAAGDAKPAADGKLRLAYLSGDFRVHPVGLLIAELLERHDRQRFEIIGVSFGPDDGSALRSRIAKAVDRFYDVRAEDDRAAALLLRRLGIDIAVDLSGHTDNSRPGILQYRPAPVAVNYLGFSGTMGAGFIDYIIGDPVALPFTLQPFYTERIVHLPDCYMVNDTTKAIAPQCPTRAAAGLPEQGFVFCAFNSSYKISRDIFAVWLRLLARVPGSVLWLSQADRRATDNLRAAARAGGVDPDRLVFAPRTPAMADHFARHRLADLFLDTPGYNAHSTASDALWSGLPVLTCAGTTFPGRIAASLVQAIGLPELVTGTLADYEALALRLASDSAMLAAIRQTLARNRLASPLFDSDRFRRHIEAAYLTMAAIHRRGEAPRSFSVAPFGT